MRYDLGQVHARKRSHLPHWDVEHGIYFVTWHLADAIPPAERAAIEQRCDWYAQILRTRHHAIADAHLELIRRYKRRLINRTLDLELGSSMLCGDAAAVVANSLLFFDNTRYELYAWCVMPNHVHVVFTCEPAHGLEEIIHTWKSYTSKRVNEITGRVGQLWMADYFDTTMRSTRQLQRTIEYVTTNPAAAGLSVWPYSASYPERIARVIG